MIVTVGASEVDNLDKYKSYIQRRRVGSSSSETDLPTRTEAKSEHSEASFADGYADTFKGFAGYGQSQESNKTYGTKNSSSLKDTLEDMLKEEPSDHAADDAHYSRTQAANLHRTDPGLYRQLYGQNHKNSRTSRFSSYPGNYYGYGSSAHAEISDNRTTVLAIKIIKQALACFALLGIIVLMQQRDDMTNVLAFIKKYLIDSHIEPQSILTGVENIVKECSRFLGGSP